MCQYSTFCRSFRSHACCFRLHELQNCAQSAETLCLFFRMTDFSDFGCLDFKQHESCFSKTVTQIKSQNIFFERFLKAQQSYNIFFPGCQQIHAENPGGNFGIFKYLITKRAVTLYLLYNESCFSGTTIPFLSMVCFFELLFSVAAQQKHLLHVSEAHFIFTRQIAKPFPSIVVD